MHFALHNCLLLFYQMLLHYQNAASKLADVNEEKLGHGAGMHARRRHVL